MKCLLVIFLIYFCCVQINAEEEVGRLSSWFRPTKGKIRKIWYNNSRLQYSRRLPKIGEIIFRINVTSKNYTRRPEARVLSSATRQNAEDPNHQYQVVGSTPITSIERSELASSLSHAGCDLYDQIVTIPNDKPNVLLYPSCVQIKQCAGCCGHSSLACKPTSTTPKTVQVMKYTYDGKSAHPVEKVTYIQLQEHTACQCQCKLSMDDCNPDMHYFDDWDCKCMCKNERETCPANKRWDEDLCGCRCASVTNCGSGFTFDMNTCSCVEDTERGVVVRVTEQQLATRAPATTVNPCATLRCPRRYTGYLYANGMCGCEFVG